MSLVRIIYLVEITLCDHALVLRKDSRAFSVAFSHLYKRSCPSVCPSVRLSIPPFVRPSVPCFFSYVEKNTEKIENDIIKNDAMSDDEEVAPDVPSWYTGTSFSAEQLKGCNN